VSYIEKKYQSGGISFPAAPFFIDMMRIIRVSSYVDEDFIYSYSCHQVYLAVALERVEKIMVLFFRRAINFWARKKWRESKLLILLNYF